MNTSEPVKPPVKHRVCSIYLHRSEGPASDLGAVHLPACDYPTRTVWAGANDTLRAWARTAPDLDHERREFEGDLVAFEVVFDNGAVYRGSYRLTRRDVEDADVQQSCLSLLHFYAGQFRPVGISTGEYEAFLAEREDDCLAATAMLDEYDFGGDLVPPVGLGVRIGGLTDVEQRD